MIKLSHSMVKVHSYPSLPLWYSSPMTSQCDGTCFVKISGLGLLTELQGFSSNRGVIQSGGSLPKVEALRYILGTQPPLSDAVVKINEYEK